MTDVRVTVECKTCRDVDEDGCVNFLEMKGADTIYENNDTRMQSRTYICPRCGFNVQVSLDFRGN